MNSYTRLDFAEELVKRQNVTMETAKKTVETVLDILSNRLADGQRLEFRGFGVLDVFLRKPKIGRNPKRPADGVYQIPAKRVVRFRAGRELDDRLNPPVLSSVPPSSPLTA